MALQLRSRENSRQLEARGPNRFGGALLAVDHANDTSHLAPGIDECPRSGDGGSAAGHNVLDNGDRVARFERALDAVPGPVGLRLAPHE